VKKATGCDWTKWVFVLDKAGGKEMSHPELVAHIREKYKTPGWWTQMVAVGYERIRGLRAQGQMRSGTGRSARARRSPLRWRSFTPHSAMRVSARSG